MEFICLPFSTFISIIIFKRKNHIDLQMNFINKLANFTLIAKNMPEKLNRITQILKQNQVSLSYMSTNKTQSSLKPNETIKIDISIRNNINLNNIQQQLRKEEVYINKNTPITVPWFPMSYQETNMIGQTLLQSKEDKNHTQFQDQVYKLRRNYLVQVSRSHKMGQKIKDIDYLPQQTQLWKKIYKKLDYLHKDSMSHRYLNQKQALKKQFNLQNRIPQLQQMSQYLKSKTGFTIKPTVGILCVRQFLNSFAFKLFCSTQFIRNFKNPEYTPQPDIVHESIGHVTMLADPQVAQLTHKIGLLSLGASDRDIHRLGALYHYTIEFGVCKQANKILGYGAGIASSFGEIEHMMSKNSRFQKLNIEQDAQVEYPVHTVQPLYRCTQSFQQALKDLDRYGQKIQRPFIPTYNQLQKRIEVDRNIKRLQLQRSNQ